MTAFFDAGLMALLRDLRLQFEGFNGHPPEALDQAPCQPDPIFNPLSRADPEDDAVLHFLTYSAVI